MQETTSHETDVEAFKQSTQTPSNGILCAENTVRLPSNPAGHDSVRNVDVHLDNVIKVHILLRRFLCNENKLCD